MKNLIFLALLMTACSSGNKSEKTFSRMVNSGQCSLASKHIPGFEYKKVEGGVRLVTGKTARVAAAGIAFTGDAIIVLTGGVILPVAVCSPLIAIELSGGGNGDLSGSCLKLVGESVRITDYDSMGKATWSKTSDWECPTLDTTIGYMTQISDCHYENGETQKASKQLNKLLNKNAFNGCVNPKQKVALKEKLEGYL